MSSPDDDAIRQRLATRVAPGFDGVSVEDGWLPMLDELDRRLAALDPHYEIHQAKEKFGGLRFYTAHDDTLDPQIEAQVRQLIADAQDRSLSICEQCGQPGTHIRVRMWSRTLCPMHQAEAQTGAARRSLDDDDD